MLLLIRNAPQPRYASTRLSDLPATHRYFRAHRHRINVMLGALIALTALAGWLIPAGPALWLRLRDGHRKALLLGHAFHTSDTEQATLALPGLGEVELDSGTTLTVKKLGAEDRLVLQQGSLHARLTSGPVIVETPAAIATDIRCDCQLTVAPSGNTLLHVTKGEVALQSHGVTSRVPAGFDCDAQPSRAPGVPLPADASAELRIAATQFETGEPTGLIQLLTDQSVDPRTLWNLLQRASGPERDAVKERLLALRPQLLKLDEAQWWATLTAS